MIAPVDIAHPRFSRRAALVAVLVLGSGIPARAASGTREQCEMLTKAAVSMARELLRNHGEFPPYGVGLSAGDEVVELDEGDGRDAPRPPHAGEALRERLAEVLKSGAVQATALVYEATIAVPSSGTRSDAVAIQLAHRDGYRAVIVYPYRFQGGDVVFGPSQVIEHKGVLPRDRGKGKRR